MLMRHESPSYTLGRYTGYAPNTVMGIGEGASTTSVPPSKIVVLSISRGRQRSIAYNSTVRGRRQVVRPKLPKLLARQAPAKPAKRVVEKCPFQNRDDSRDDDGNSQSKVLPVIRSESAIWHHRKRPRLECRYFALLSRSDLTHSRLFGCLSDA